MAWLTRQGEVLASVGSGTPVIVGRRIWPVRGPDRDVAWCRTVSRVGEDPVHVVTRLRRLTAAWSVAVVAPGATVVVAPAGAFERWCLAVGDELTVTGG